MAEAFGVGGHPRSEAVYQANLDFCRNQTGGGIGPGDDTPAFKKCMATRGYRW